MASVLILGGGFGGVAAATELRKGLPAEHTVTVIDRKAGFMMGLRKLWVMAGLGTRQSGTRPLAALAAKGISVRQEIITSIDPQTRMIMTDQGKHIADYMVIALGAEPRADLVPGFTDAAFNLYDSKDSERLAAAVAALSHGRVVISILGMPYRCPPAPYEAAMLLDHVFNKRDVRSEIEIHVTTPAPMSLPVLGQPGCGQLEALLAERRITFHANKKTVRLEGKKVFFEDKSSLDADLLIGVVPHRVPAVVKMSGLTPLGTASEWIKADARTLRTDFRGVYAVGDNTEILMANKMPLPKAGILAEAQGKIAAANIIEEINERPPLKRFDGKGYCFVETGGGKASVVMGEFLAAPTPKVELKEPSVEGFEKKIDFEKSRLESWFS